MRALVFADRSGAALAPLDRQYAVALLPVAGKELILYTVEDLIGAGIREAVFVLCDHAERIEALLGDGQRWGARFRFVLSRGGESPSALWPRISLGEDQPILALRGDLLRTPAVAGFLEGAQGQSSTAVCGLAADPRGSLILLRPGYADPRPLLEMLHFDAPAPPPGEGMLRLPEGAALPIVDLPAYHAANLDLVGGRIPGLAPAGREVALGLMAGRRASVSPRSLKQGQAYVGEYSRVSPEAELLGRVSIEREVVVDRGATLYDSVILPHSYVGELVEVGNAIVAGDTLIRVDTGVVLSIPDAFLLGRMSREGAEPEGGRLADRIAGAVLLALSLPLWPLALAAAALARSGKGGGLVASETLVGNCRSLHRAGAGCKGAFFAWRFRTSIPILAGLPRILAVISGDLSIFGVSPLTREEHQSRTEDWQKVRDRAPVGLIGPTQILLGSAAPLQERLLSDAFYAGQRHGLLSDLRTLGQGLAALFGRRAWSGLEIA